MLLRNRPESHLQIRFQHYMARPQIPHKFETSPNTPKFIPLGIHILNYISKTPNQMPTNHHQYI